MIEYVLTRFSDPHAVEIPVKEDGSMHVFRKQWHVNNSTKLTDWPESGITTPIYPFRELHLSELIKQFQSHYPSWNQHRKVLIYAPDQSWSEINLLFQHYKISVGLNTGLEIFNGSDISVLQRWQGSHESWQDLRPWQWREWFSIFYPAFVHEWQVSRDQVDDSWLCVTNRDILHDTENALYCIAEFCDIQLTRPIKSFCLEYKSKQDYICREYHTIDNIVNAVIEHEPLTWQPLSIVGEAILQQKFRRRGYEWRCDGLDILPCDSIVFEKLIYQTEENLHA